MIGDNVHGMCLIVVFAIGKGISTYWWNANNWDNLCRLEMGIVLMVTQQ